MATHKLLLLPGDGIGPEVMGEVKRLVGWLNKMTVARLRDQPGAGGRQPQDAGETPAVRCDYPSDSAALTTAIAPTASERDP